MSDRFSASCRPLLPILLAGATGSLVGPVAARADTVVLQAVANNTIFNDGALPPSDLSSGAGDYLFAGRTSPNSNYIQRSLLRFDLSAIPAGATIQSVEVQITVLRAPGGSPVVDASLHRVTSSWGEGGSSSFGGGGAPSTPGDASWVYRFLPNTRWSNAGGDFAHGPSATTAIDTSPAMYTWDSTPGLVADVTSWIAQPSGNFGWIIISDESQPTTTRKFASRHYFDVDSRPALRVTFSTTPACLADINQDGVVDGSDFVAFINSFALGDVNLDAAADVVVDGTIDGNDFVAFINAFALGC